MKLHVQCALFRSVCLSPCICFRYGQSSSVQWHDSRPRRIFLFSSFQLHRPTTTTALWSKNDRRANWWQRAITKNEIKKYIVPRPRLNPPLPAVVSAPVAIFNVKLIKSMYNYKTYLSFIHRVAGRIAQTLDTIRMLNLATSSYSECEIVWIFRNCWDAAHSSHQCKWLCIKLCVLKTEAARSQRCPSATIRCMIYVLKWKWATEAIGWTGQWCAGTHSLTPFIHCANECTTHTYTHTRRRVKL